jgi:undecaprenyl-diphosphatase
MFTLVILSIIQGLTEFIPVSSSGHLILARVVLGANLPSGLAIDAVLQMSTALAAAWYFRAYIVQLILSLVRNITNNKTEETAQDARLVLGLILGTLPALFFGLLLQDKMETTFRDPLLVAVALIVGSILFLVAETYHRPRTTRATLSTIIWMGMFQALAIIPGMSRSGSTMSGGLLLGLDRKAVTRTSFLLSLPILLGSGLIKLIELIRHWELAKLQGVSPLALTLGFIISFTTGYLCIRWLIPYLERHSLRVFAWYRLGLAGIVLLILLIPRL